MSTSEVALFRLEQTLTADSIGNAALELAEFYPERYGDLPSIEHGFERMHRVVQAFQHNSNWLNDEVAERTKQHTEALVAPWSTLVIYDQVANHGREIGIWSDFLPSHIVKAYAEGIENKLLGVRIRFIQGVKSSGAHRRYLGELRTSGGVELSGKLQAKGLHLGMVATGASNALAILQQAEHPLLVNPKRHVAVNGSYHSQARLNWDKREPHRTLFARPYEPTTTKYNLANPRDQLAFVDAASETL